MSERADKLLGLTDADKAGLEKRLKQGAAAVVAMASADELDATKQELSSLGGEVQSFEMPADTTDMLAAATDVAADESAAPSADTG